MDSPRRKEGPEKQTIPEESLTSITSSGNGGSGLIKGLSFALLRNDGMQFSPTDAAFIRAKKKNHRHICLRDQPVEVRLRDKLQPKDRFKVISGMGETMFIAQDHNADDMLKTGQI